MGGGEVRPRVGNDATLTFLARGEVPHEVAQNRHSRTTHADRWQISRYFNMRVLALEIVRFGEKK